ncbi:MAG: DNA polymerase III subunit delta' [Anaerolineales bacterium]|nr:DNA polymerase III subunit delta' [Anaerolineales bacterium]
MPWDLFGHEWAVDLLRKDIASGRLAHAYLFTGADGIGKRTLALQFARAVNCEAPPEAGGLCGTCRSCRLIGAEKHPDLFLLKPKGPGARILVDAAREVAHAVMLKPTEAARRIALLADFHRALPNAANALLKTIEEPPPSAILLLTAESADELLPTIPSRCRVLALRPLREQTVAQALRDRWQVPTGRAEMLARLSGGRLGWAVEQASWEDLAAEREALFREWAAILRGGRAARFAAAEKAAADRDRLRNALQCWESFGHDLLIRTLSQDAEIANVDFRSQIDELVRRVLPRQARDWLAALRRAEEQIDRNANVRLALEAAFLDAPKV